MLEERVLDNITHTLAGILVAEGAVRLRARREGKAPSARWVRWAWLCSVVGNNLPDVDFAYVFITPGKLGYLLHHRGHTHTFALGLLLGALAFGVLTLIARRRGAFDGADWRWLLALTLLGPLLHVAMDGSNVYGVHPLWPLYDGWLYGDAIFIIEPLFWSIAVPVVLAETRWRWGKLPLYVLLAATLTLPWLTGLVSVPMRFGIVALLLGMLVLCRRVGAGARAVVGIAGCLTVFAAFVVGGALARRRLAAVMVRDFPRERVRDLVLSPFPASPECWTAIAISTDPGGAFIMRRAVVAAVPGLSARDSCPRFTQPTTAPLAPVAASGNQAIAWYSEFRAPLSELRRLASTSCNAAAFLRFARAPFWLSDPSVLTVGDLRFDNQRARGFAEMDVPRPEPACPRWVPPWIPPRQDVLAP